MSLTVDIHRMHIYYILLCEMILLFACVCGVTKTFLALLGTLLLLKKKKMSDTVSTPCDKIEPKSSCDFSNSDIPLFK